MELKRGINCVWDCCRKNFFFFFKDWQFSKPLNPDIKISQEQWGFSSKGSLMKSTSSGVTPSTWVTTHWDKLLGTEEQTPPGRRRWDRVWECPLYPHHRFKREANAVFDTLSTVLKTSISPAKKKSCSGVLRIQDKWRINAGCGGPACSQSNQ